MQDLLTWQLPLGVFVGMVVFWLIGMFGYRRGAQAYIGRIMLVEQIPRNTRLRFRGRIGAEHFLFTKSVLTKNGLEFRPDSRIARSPGGGELDALTSGNQFMVVERTTGQGPVVLEFMKLIS